MTTAEMEELERLVRKVVREELHLAIPDPYKDLPHEDRPEESLARELPRGGYF